jgi:ssDNA-binding Zn-finger/Zn-ribbon topoisomerase 1
MVLRETTKFLFKDDKSRKFHGCSNYPACNERHGAHPDGRPLGKPGNQEVRKLRHELHLLAGSIWNENDPEQKRQCING